MIRRSFVGWCRAGFVGFVTERAAARGTITIHCRVISCSTHGSLGVRANPPPDISRHKYIVFRVRIESGRVLIASENRPFEDSLLRPQRKIVRHHATKTRGEAVFKHM